MTTMTAEHLTRNPAVVRRALGEGSEVVVTFHGKPYARVVAYSHIEAERAELERLRARVAELEGAMAMA